MSGIDPRLLAVAAHGRHGAPPLPREGWHAHLDSVMAHGLAGLFSASAAAGRVHIDDTMAERLRQQLYAEAIRAVQLEGELVRVAAALENLGVAVVNGAVLAHGAYPDPVLRPFNSLEVLVPGDRVPHAVATFAGYGYVQARPESGFEPRAGTSVVLEHAGGVAIHLRRTLATGTAGGWIDVDEVLAGRRSVRVGTDAVPAPPWEAHLVECAVHAVVGDRLARPLLLRDIAEVAQHPALDPALAADLSYRWQVADLVAVGLRAARDGLGLDLPHPLAALVYDAEPVAPASDHVQSARRRVDGPRNGDMRRQSAFAHADVGPEPEFVRWAYGDDSPPSRVYGPRMSSPGGPTIDERHGDALTPYPVAPEPTPAAPLPALPGPAAGPAAVSWDAGSDALALRTVNKRAIAAAHEHRAPASMQERWSRARPPRQSRNGSSGSNGSNGHAPDRSGGGGAAGYNGNGHASAHTNGNGHRGDEDDTGPAAGDTTPTPRPGASPPARSGVAHGVAGGAALAVTAVGSQLGSNSLGIVLVPLAGVLLAVAASRRIVRLRPDEAWVGQWLVLAVVVKLCAAYFRYHTLVTDYEGVGDASMYDEYGIQFATAWLNGGAEPDLPDLRETNFIRWFTGLVYYLFGTNMVIGFLVFGLLALVGSYLWYRATVEAVPRVDKRLYLALVLFAPSIAFWPAAIGKESLMQLGIGVVALGTAYLMKQRLMRGLGVAVAGGWLLWVVRPHLVALVTLAGGVAYLGGRVRAGEHGLRGLVGRPVGLLAVVLLVSFTVTQGAEFLGMEELSLEAIETELDEQTERSAQGGSEFDNGDNSLSPLRLPEGAATVLLRPFPWETESQLQLLSSLESALFAVLIISRLSSVRTALTRARTMPFLLSCWALVGLYAMAFSSFANFGLLVRQRSLVLPALFVLIAVRPVAASAPSRGRPPVAAGGVRVAS